MYRVPSLRKEKVGKVAPRNIIGVTREREEKIIIKRKNKHLNGQVITVLCDLHSYMHGSKCTYEKKK